MAQEKFKAPKVQVRNRPGSEGALTVGANMEILIDGVPLVGATSLKFEVSATKMAKIYIEMVGEMEIDANIPIEASQSEPTGLVTPEGKQVERWSLGSYSPVAIDIEPE
jgi:hypothetical protein